MSIAVIPRVRVGIFVAASKSLEAWLYSTLTADSTITISITADNQKQWSTIQPHLRKYAAISDTQLAFLLSCSRLLLILQTRSHADNCSVLFTLAESSGKSNVTVWCPSVCPVFFSNLLHHGGQNNKEIMSPSFTVPTHPSPLLTIPISQYQMQHKAAVY